MMAFTNQEVDSLLSELEEFDHEMEGWISTDEANAQFNKDNSTAKMKKQQKLKSEQRYNMDMEHYRKMGKLDSMLVTLGGGRNGFWDARDHDGFLRIWTQYVLTNRRLITDVVVIEKIQEQALGSIEPDGEGGTLVADGETGPDFVSMEVPPPGDNITNTNLHPSGSISVSYDDTRWILPHQIHKTLLKRIPLVVLGKDVDEINAHIKWYLQHTMLHLEKKKLLSQWKRNKLIGGGARATDDVDSYLQTQSSQISGKIGEPRSATPSGLSRRGSSGGASGSGSVTSNTEDERELTRLRVKMWREEKALAAAQRKADEEAQKRLLEQKKFEQVCTDFCICIIGICDGMCIYLCGGD